MAIGAVKKAELELERLIVDTTVQDKAIAHPSDRRLLDVARAQIIHRGRYKTMRAKQRRWLRRRQPVEPVIGHLKADHRMDGCWLKGSDGDAIHAVLCAAEFNLHWLLQAVARIGLLALLSLINIAIAIVRLLRPKPIAVDDLFSIRASA